MTEDEIKDIAEDVIWDAFMAGGSLREGLEIRVKRDNLSPEDEERVAHTIQCANIKVWWDDDFVP